MNSLREQVNSVPHQLFQELALRVPHGVHVGLRIELHRRAEVLVAQHSLYGFRVHLKLHQRRRQRVAKVVKAEASRLDRVCSTRAKISPPFRDRQ